MNSILRFFTGKSNDTINSLPSWYIESFQSFIDQFETESSRKFSVISQLPFLNDRTSLTHFDGHYIYHPAWATRVLIKTAPAVHVDISSTLHFCSMLSAFMPVEFYDYRPADLKLDQLKTGKTDLTKLHFANNSIASLSCMHTVEHIGLGRYGDPIDPDGDLKAINEIKRVLAPGGNLLFVVPVGLPKILFNAHRIYSYQMIIEYFSDLLLKDFSLVDDAQQFHSPSNAAQSDQQVYGCGCFWFQKKDV